MNRNLIKIPANLPAWKGSGRIRRSFHVSYPGAQHREQCHVSYLVNEDGIDVKELAGELAGFYGYDNRAQAIRECVDRALDELDLPAEGLFPERAQRLAISLGTDRSRAIVAAIFWVAAQEGTCPHCDAVIGKATFLQALVDWTDQGLYTCPACERRMVVYLRELEVGDYVARTETMEAVAARLMRAELDIEPTGAEIDAVVSEV